MPQKLINLKSDSYEYEPDRMALKAFNAIPGSEIMTRFVMGWTHIRWYKVFLAGTCLHITNDSCPSLFNVVKNVADTLCINVLPEIYSNWDFTINAYTRGFNDQSLLMIDSGAADLLSDDELCFVIGREIGHIKSNHVLYQTMAAKFTEIVAGANIAAIATPLYYALVYWVRMSEYTADRAGLLANQNFDAAIKAIMKQSGLPRTYYDKIDIKIFVEQSYEFKNGFSGVASNAIRKMSIVDNTTPWAMLRVAELADWVDSGKYDEILRAYKGKECRICHHAIARELTVCPYCGGVCQL